jgi:hypothetical protein
MDIDHSQVPRLLVEACPTFAGSSGLREWTEEWAAEGEPPLYVLASEFVRHLARLNADGRHDEFPSTFEMIEHLHRHGDEHVGELATIGFIEDLQNTNLHPDGSRPSDFVPYLGPVSKWWWDEVELFWAGQIRTIGSSGRPHPPNMGNSARAVTSHR